MEKKGRVKDLHLSWEACAHRTTAWGRENLSGDTFFVDQGDTMQFSAQPQWR